MKNLKIKVIELDINLERDGMFKYCGILDNTIEIVRLFIIQIVIFFIFLYTIITYPYNIIINIIEYIITKITDKKLREKVEKDILNHEKNILKNIGLLYLKDTYENRVLDNIEEVNNYLTNNRKVFTFPHNIKLKNQLSVLTMFIYTYITYLNVEFSTFHKNNNTIQCKAERRRSIGDIYLVCKYYFPHITIIDVIKSLSTLLKENLIHSSRCGVIEKYVFTRGSGKIDGKLEFTDIVGSDKLFKLFKEN